MGERPILDEVGEALRSYQWGAGAWTIHDKHNFSAECKVCQGDTSAMSAVVLRAAEKRFRSIAQRFRDAEAEQTTLGAQWSAAEQARQWDEVADMLAKDLPADSEEAHG